MQKQEQKPIVLRSATRADSRVFFEWINDRNLVSSSASFRPVSEFEHESWFNSYITSTSSNVLFVIALPDGEAIGYCQLIDISTVHRNAEVRIRIAEPKHRGLGYGYEALRQMIDFAKLDLNLHRLFLTVAHDNQRAIGVYQKVGFDIEGILRDAAFFDGKYTDLMAMGLLLKGAPS